MESDIVKLDWYPILIFDWDNIKMVEASDLSNKAFCQVPEIFRPPKALKLNVIEKYIPLSTDLVVVKKKNWMSDCLNGHFFPALTGIDSNIS